MPASARSLLDVGLADPVDVGEADLDALVEGDVDPRNPSQSLLPLTLLVTRVLADHQHAAVPADDLALLTHRLDRRSYLHGPFQGVWSQRDGSGDPCGRRYHPVTHADASRPQTRPASIARTCGRHLRRRGGAVRHGVQNSSDRFRPAGDNDAGAPCDRLPASPVLRGGCNEAKAAAGRGRCGCRGAGAAGPALADSLDAANSGGLGRLRADQHPVGASSAPCSSCSCSPACCSLEAGMSRMKNVGTLVPKALIGDGRRRDDLLGRAASPSRSATARSSARRASSCAITAIRRRPSGSWGCPTP